MRDELVAAPVPCSYLSSLSGRPHYLGHQCARPELCCPWNKSQTGLRHVKMQHGRPVWKKSDKYLKSPGKIHRFFVLSDQNYDPLPVQTSRGCNSQDSLGTIVTKVFSTSWQTLFSTTNGQAGVTQISLLTWSQDVLGICFLVVICLVLQSWKIKINSKINWIHVIFEMNMYIFEIYQIFYVNKI